MHWGVHIRRRNHGDTLTHTHRHRRVCQDLNRNACKKLLGKLPVDNLEHSSPNSPECRCQVGVQLKDLPRAMAKLEEMCLQIEKMTNFLVLNCMYASPLSAHPRRLRRGENVKSLGSATQRGGEREPVQMCCH